ncbi:MAG TPA: PEP-utilizing enzyme [Candidatus Micrarchaeota archaeon]|nr:PEP-utilizing enzyme [Candidatus Micrarchaeota archaeon]
MAIDSAKIILKGLGASPGIGKGKAKLIPTPKDIGLMEKGDILLTDMTTPDFVPAMKKASAIITNTGGRTCHAAIVSREMGIPCIVGAKGATDLLRTGMFLTVDATRGIIYEGNVADLKSKDESAAQATQSSPAAGGVQLAMAAAEAPVTGTKVYVNLAEVDLAEKVSKLPCDGVGLLRAEFMIADIGEHPKKIIAEGRQQEYIDKLADKLRTFAQAFYPRQVVYRANDFKTNEYKNLKGGEQYEPVEANPMMGYRGCARYIAEPEGFKMELMAIKKVREEFGLKNLHLMIPFVRRIGEIRAIKDMLKEVQIHRTRDFKLWIMVEVPSTVFLIDEFCAEGIDGVSIGSNDLTQLILGIDRDNSTLAEGFDERNHAVLKAIETVIKSCNKHGVTCSICGQGPSVYPDFTERLIEFGITSVSVNPDAVESTKRIVASAERKVMLKRLAKIADGLEHGRQVQMD